MALVQHVMTGADARLIGVETEAADADTVVVGQDGNTVAWVTTLDPGVDPSNAINPDYPAQDWRA